MEPWGLDLITSKATKTNIKRTFFVCHDTKSFHTLKKNIINYEKEKNKNNKKR